MGCGLGFCGADFYFLRICRGKEIYRFGKGAFDVSGTINGVHILHRPSLRSAPMNPIWTTLAAIAAIYGIVWACHATFGYAKFQERMTQWFYAASSFSVSLICLIAAI